MPDEMFIEAYTRGHISRRAFIRRLVAGGFTVATAVAYSEALAPGAGATTGPVPPFPSNRIHWRPPHHVRF